MNRHRVARRAPRIGETGVIYLMTWQDLRQQVRKAMQAGANDIQRQDAVRAVCRAHPGWCGEDRPLQTVSQGAAAAMKALQQSIETDLPPRGLPLSNRRVGQRPVHVRYPG